MPDVREDVHAKLCAECGAKQKNFVFFQIF